MELVHNRDKVEIGLEKSKTLTFVKYGIYPSISRPYTFGRLGGGIWDELMSALFKNGEHKILKSFLHKEGYFK